MPRSSPRWDIFVTNASALAAEQQMLARGMVQLNSDDLDAFSAIEIPDLDPAKVKEFVDNAVRRTSGDALALLGLGSPELLMALRETLPADRGLVIIEPTLEIALRLLSQKDFTELFSTPYTALVFGAQDSELRGMLEHVISSWGVGELQLIGNPMRPMGEQMPRLVARMIHSALQSVEISMATGAYYGNEAISSITANLKYAVDAFDLTPLAGQYKGVPAFCVAAGPSLDADIKHLAQAKERGLIIAADAAVPPLVAAGIQPDIVTTIDLIKKKKVVFEETYVRDALLVSLLSAHPELVDAWIGPRAFAVDDHPLALWAAKHTVPVSHFGSLGNVAHLSYSLARGLGCDPIVLVGTDLAFARSGRTYASGVVHLPKEEQEQIPPELEKHLVKLQANDGGEVTSYANMETYIRTFTQLAQGSGETFTTALEGAQIPGIPYRSLAEIVESAPDVEVARPLSGVAPKIEEAAERRKALLAAISDLISQLMAYADEASAFADEVDEMRQELGRDKLKAEGAVKMLQPAWEKLAAHQNMSDLLDPLQPAVFYEIQRLVRRTHGMSDPVERAKQRLMALAGPAASAAQVARHIVLALGEARPDLEKSPSSRIERSE